MLHVVVLVAATLLLVGVVIFVVVVAATTPRVQLAVINWAMDMRVGSGYEGGQ